MFSGRPTGLAALLKEGSRHFQGQEEAVFRNIDAAKKLSEILRTTYGPTGMSKLVNNFLDKKFLTSDASTVVSELEVAHPAAKILVLAAQMQNSEFGDGTNFVVVMAAELLSQAGQLMQQGIHVSSIISGYEMGLKKALELLESKVVFSMSSVTNKEELVRVVHPVVATKLKGIDISFVSLLADACLSVMPENHKTFNTDNVRVTKLVGGNLKQSQIVNGMVLAREPKTACREKRNCKIIVLANALEIAGTEGTGTVLIKTADELMNFAKTEETEMENLIKGFHDAGVEALICGGAINPLALHFLDKYDMWAVATPSKFDIKRYCRTLRVPALQRMTPPMAEEIGLAEYAGVMEYGSQYVSVVRGKDTKLTTILLRGPTRALLDEVERATDDVVSLTKACTKDCRFVPGGGAVEAELAEQLETYGATLSGLEQYAVERFAQALLVFGKLIAENAGQNAMESMAQLQSEHKKGKHLVGIDVTRVSGNVTRDVTVENEADPSSAFKQLTFPVLDHYMTKRWALRLAVDAAITVLRVDQIIMAKPAGGPKMPQQGHWDAADDRTPAF